MVYSSVCSVVGVTGVYVCRMRRATTRHARRENLRESRRPSSASRTPCSASCSEWVYRRPARGFVASKIVSNGWHVCCRKSTLWSTRKRVWWRLSTRRTSNWTSSTESRLRRTADSPLSAESWARSSGLSCSCWALRSRPCRAYWAARRAEAVAQVGAPGWAPSSRWSRPCRAPRPAAPRSAAPSRPLTLPRRATLDRSPLPLWLRSVGPWRANYQSCQTPDAAVCMFAVRRSPGADGAASHAQCTVLVAPALQTRALSALYLYVNSFRWVMVIY